MENKSTENILGNLQNVRRWFILHFFSDGGSIIIFFLFEFIPACLVVSPESQ